MPRTLAARPAPAYIVNCPGNRTMAINAQVISGSDPGAVPGGSTKFLRWGIMGPK